MHDSQDNFQPPWQIATFLLASPQPKDWSVRKAILRQREEEAGYYINHQQKDNQLFYY